MNCGETAVRMVWPLDIIEAQVWGAELGDGDLESTEGHTWTDMQAFGSLLGAEPGELAEMLDIDAWEGVDVWEQILSREEEKCVEKWKVRPPERSDITPVFLFEQ